ncbi:pyrroline-5-carboxylate reductase family protein [Chloroflexota bacterium]
MFKDFTIAFIGSGVMAEAMINGLLNGSKVLKPNQILAADPHESRGKELVERYGIQWTPDNVEAAKDANVVVLSVKPQMFDKVAPELHGNVPSAALVLSIMAGVPIKRIATGLGIRRVVRAMPNTPAPAEQESYQLPQVAPFRHILY